MRILEIPTLSPTGGEYLSNNITSRHIKDAPLQKAISSNKVQSLIKMDIGDRKIACLNLHRYIEDLKKVIKGTHKSDYVSMLNIILTNAIAKKEMITQLVEYELILADDYEDLPLTQKMDIHRLNSHVSNQNIWQHVRVDEDILAYIKVPTLHTKDGEYDVYITWFLITTGTTDNLARPRLNRGRVVANG